MAVIQDPLVARLAGIAAFELCRSIAIRRCFLVRCKPGTRKIARLRADHGRRLTGDLAKIAKKGSAGVKSHSLSNAPHFAIRFVHEHTKGLLDAKSIHVGAKINSDNVVQ